MIYIISYLIIDNPLIILPIHCHGSIIRGKDDWKDELGLRNDKIRLLRLFFEKISYSLVTNNFRFSASDYRVEYMGRKWMPCMYPSSVRKCELKRPAFQKTDSQV